MHAKRYVHWLGRFARQYPLGFGGELQDLRDIRPDCPNVGLAGKRAGPERIQLDLELGQILVAGVILRLVGAEIAARADQQEERDGDADHQREIAFDPSHRCRINDGTRPSTEA